MAPRYRVVSFDLDGTLIHPAIFNVIADAMGFGEPLKWSYDEYVAGRMSLEEAFRHDFAYFVGKDVAAMHRILETTDRWTPGIAAAVEELHRAGLEVWVTTDQPSFLAEFTKRFGIDEVVCTPAPPDAGKVTADVNPAFAKWPNLQARLTARGIPPTEVVHIGNGTNDIPVFEQVGLSIAVNALHPSVPAAATRALDRLTDARLVCPLVLRE